MAVIALVYAGAVSAGLTLHLQDEGAEAHALIQAVNDRAPGDPLPEPPLAGDELDCLLCQVLTGPAHPGADAGPGHVAPVAEVLAPPAQGPGVGELSLPPAARDPPRA